MYRGAEHVECVDLPCRRSSLPVQSANQECLLIQILSVSRESLAFDTRKYFVPVISALGREKNSQEK